MMIDNSILSLKAMKTMQMINGNLDDTKADMLACGDYAQLVRRACAHSCK